MVKTITTKIHFNAEISKVWDTLMDFENWSEWNKCMNFDETIVPEDGEENASEELVKSDEQEESQPTENPPEEASEEAEPTQDEANEEKEQPQEESKEVQDASELADKLDKVNDLEPIKEQEEEPQDKSEEVSTKKSSKVVLKEGNKATLWVKRHGSKVWRHYTVRFGTIDNTRYVFSWYTKKGCLVKRHHTFELSYDRLQNQTCLTHSEAFTGVLPLIGVGASFSQIERTWNKVNKSLKVHMDGPEPEESPEATSAAEENPAEAAAEVSEQEIGSGRDTESKIDIAPIEDAKTEV